MPFRALAPQASASTNFATRAIKNCVSVTCQSSARMATTRSSKTVKTLISSKKGPGTYIMLEKAATSLSLSAPDSKLWNCFRLD